MLAPDSTHSSTFTSDLTTTLLGTRSPDSDLTGRIQNNRSNACALDHSPSSSAADDHAAFINDGDVHCASGDCVT